MAFEVNGGLAFVYPGQGAQYIGMGKDAYDAYPSSRAAFNEASLALGEDVAAMVFDGDEKTLALTRNTQPALLTVCAALTRPLNEAGVVPDVSAGLSIGEYAAYVEAGAFDFADAVRVVRRRGELMQDEVPAGEGGMAAILGLPDDAVADCCREAEAAERASGRADAAVEPANFNCPGQVVIAGHTAAVARASELCKARGAKRAVALAVSAPFHCGLLNGAGEKLGAILAGINMRDMRLPVVANATGEYVGDAATAKELLARQVSSPVRWEACVRAMIARGARTFVEIGPGKTLAGFIKKIDREATVINVATASDIEDILK